MNTESSETSAHPTEFVTPDERAEWLESKVPHHRPNVAQPDRCPSMDPYDGGLQCGRKIHDDDRCGFGGIGWIKGEPRKWSPDEDMARRLILTVEALEAALTLYGAPPVCPVEGCGRVCCRHHDRDYQDGGSND